MAQTFKNIRLPYITEGVVRTAQLNDTVAPENSVQIAVNMNFDRIGSIQTRPGVATFSSKSVLNKSGPVTIGTLQTISISRLYVQCRDFIYRYNGTGWTGIATLTNYVNKCRYTQYLNVTYICNGYDGDFLGMDDGSTFYNGAGPATYPANFPKVDYISGGFEGRLWGADKSTDTLYYTDIVQFTPPSTYTLTFNATTNFIKSLSPQDGESITALYRVPRALLVFKQNHIYRVYGAASADSYPAYNVGTYSQESIVEAKDGLYFHHSSGFYKFGYDSQPIEISRRIIDFVKAIPRSNYGNVVGIYDNYDSIKWYIGPVTVEGVTYSNCVVRYTISTQVWTIYNYSGLDYRAMTLYDDGSGNIKQLVAYPHASVSSFYVDQLDTGTDDHGSPIQFEMIDRWRSFTDMYSKSKSVSGMMVMADNAAGTILQYQTEKNGVDEWDYLETLNQNFDSLMPNVNSKDFNQIRFRLVGNSTGTPLVYHGIELLSIQDKGLDQN